MPKGSPASYAGLPQPVRQTLPPHGQVLFSLQDRRMIDTLDLAGMSPPGIFIGTLQLPQGRVGPLVPPFMGDTAMWTRPSYGWARA